MVYQWTIGAHVRADAQKAGERLEQLRARHNGDLTPEAVVRDARPKSSPLHACFEWDDTVAAQQYRIEQARYVLRSITVVPAHEEASEPTRAYVAVMIDHEERKVYRHVTDVMENPVLREQVVEAALKELHAWRRKHAGLKELAGLFATIDEQVALELVA